MASLERCRTMIVDDELLIRQGIKHFLDWEKEGFLIVGEASNGQEALELIENTNPHIIITDMVMPIMDGEELTRIVKNKYPHIEIIILSSFGEFDYVRSTFQSGVVDYILKPKLDAAGLLKALKTASSRIQSLQTVEKQLDANLSITQIINKLILGYEVNVDSEILTTSFPFSHYCLVGVDIRNQPENKPSEILANLEEKVKSVFQSNLSESVHYFFHNDQYILTFLINGKQGIHTEVMPILQNFLETDSRIGFVMSEEFSEFWQIGSVYKNDLLKLCNYRFYFPNMSVLTKKALPSLPAKYETFSLEWFTDEMKRRHFVEAFLYLQNHASELSSYYITDLFEYKAFFGNIIFNISILLNNMEYDVKELDQAKYSYFSSVDEAQTAEEVLRILTRFIEQAKECINIQNNQPGSLNMKKIMEYIAEHYAEPITLKDVANHFHFNPSYLSSYFSAHNSEGFIGYLNKIRIEEASRLLMKGQATISEISAMVGFSDHSYFCKVFKKIKGLSPSQFKRKQYS